MLSETDREMRNEMFIKKEEELRGAMVSLIDPIKCLFDDVHGGDLESTKTCNELIEIAQSLAHQAVLNKDELFDVFDVLILANEQVLFESARDGEQEGASVFKL